MVGYDREGARAVIALSYSNHNKQELLIEACKDGDLELVKLLIASELVDIHDAGALILVS